MIRHVSRTTGQDQNISSYHGENSQDLVRLDSAHVDVEEPMANSRYPRVNPKSGLQEEWDDHFRVPSVAQRSITSLRFNGQSTAVHSVPLENGLSLDFYARLGASDELVITFHGAYRKVPEGQVPLPAVRAGAVARGRVPGTHRVRGPDSAPGPDPQDAAQLVPERSWLGLDGRHPEGHRPCEGPLRRQARPVHRRVRGGHTAIRLSAHVPGFLTYVQALATDIHRCFPNAKKNYFSTVWPGWDSGKLLDAFPERFNMPARYRRRALDNFVYYAQSTRDPRYLETHFEPFRAALGATPTGAEEPRGKRWLALYDGEKEGHGAMTPPEFRDHLQRALAWWRARRPAHP